MEVFSTVYQIIPIPEKPEIIPLGIQVPMKEVIL